MFTTVWEIHLLTKPRPKLFAVVAVLFVVVSLLWVAASRRNEHSRARRLNALPPPQLRRIFPDGGILHLVQVIQAAANGTLMTLAQGRFQTLQRDTFSVTTLGTTMIATMDPRNVQSILALNFKSWSVGDRRKRAFHALLGHGIFTSDGAAWKHSRDLLRPSFVKSRVADVEMFETHVRCFLDRIRDLSQNSSEPIDLYPLFLQLTMDVSTEFLFGHSTRTLQKSGGDSARFAAAFERAQEAAGAAARTGGSFVVWWRRRSIATNIDYVHRFVDGLVSHRLETRKLGASNTGDATFLDELIDSLHDPVRIRSELLQILLAGRDTTAGLLSNFWWSLLRSPRAFDCLKQEVDSELQGRLPSYDQIKGLRYLRATINEALRLYPVVPVNVREAVEDTTLPAGGGPDGTAETFVPKGRIVMFNIWSMQRRTDIYGEDAESFKPERWLGDERPGWAFLPFSGGPRVCLGQQFAITEASYVIVRMLQSFVSIEGQEKGPWKEKVTLTTVNASGCRVKVRSR